MVDKIKIILEKVINYIKEKRRINANRMIEQKVFKSSQTINNFIDNVWYLKDGENILKCGRFYNNNNECCLLFYNESGKQMVFDNLQSNRVFFSMYLYIRISKTKYSRLQNETSLTNPLELDKLKDMMLFVDTLDGMYIYNNHKIRYISNVHFKRINFDNQRRVVCSVLKNNDIFDQEFSIFGDELEYTKKVKDFSDYKTNDNQKIDKNKIEIFFSNHNYKAELISEKHFKEKNMIERLNNEFEDDDTINYKVILDTSDMYELGFDNYLLQKCSKCSIYGIEVNVILDVITMSYSSPTYYSASQEQKKYLRKECNKIKKKIQDEKNIKEKDVPQYLYDKYEYDSSNNFRFIYNLLKENNVDYKTYGFFWKADYTEIYHELIKNNVIKVKWKSEYKLYDLVKKEFKDAKFQYRCSWLGNQSLDIYIPSKLIAIEYQGKQHYEPVKLFGGEDTLKKQKKSDDKKKKLCEEHDVSLIEWKYYEPITRANLLEKLKKY